MPYRYNLSLLTIAFYFSLHATQNTEPIHVLFNQGASLASFRVPSIDSNLHHTGIDPRILKKAIESGNLPSPLIINATPKTSIETIERLIHEEVLKIANLNQAYSQNNGALPFSQNITSQQIQPVMTPFFQNRTFPQSRAQDYLAPNQNPVVIPVQPAGPPLPVPFTYQPHPTTQASLKCFCCKCSCVFPH